MEIIILWVLGIRIFSPRPNLTYSRLTSVLIMKNMLDCFVLGQLPRGGVCTWMNVVVSLIGYVT